jgi:hypothetical protein
MDRHLVAVEVGVERGTDERMQLYRFALYKHRLESLDREAVEGRSAVQKYRMLLYNDFKSVPDRGIHLFDLLLGVFDI